MITDAARSARTFRNTVAVIALASAVAACSTTESPLVVDALTLNGDSAGNNSALPAKADAGQTATQPETAAVTPREKAVQSASKQVAYASTGTGAPQAADQNTVSNPASPEASATQPDIAMAGGAAEKQDRLDDTGNTAAGISEEAHKENGGFFASLFTRKPDNSALTTAYAASEDRFAPARQLAAGTQIRKEAGAREPRQAVIHQASLGETDVLPGVRQENLFGIGHKSSIDAIDTIDANEEDSPIRLASAAGMARMSARGFILQRGDVDISCIKPSLVQVLQNVERHFGEHVVITSGYRSPEHNRRVHGARNSLHMYCAATDIQVPGISKWELAKYLRAMPGRGGVGTYCHTDSVHVDVGPERDWNWRCRRRRS